MSCSQSPVSDWRLRDIWFCWVIFNSCILQKGSCGTLVFQSVECFLLAGPASDQGLWCCSHTGSVTVRAVFAPFVLMTIYGRVWASFIPALPTKARGINLHQCLKDRADVVILIENPPCKCISGLFEKMNHWLDDPLWSKRHRSTACQVGKFSPCHHCRAKSSVLPATQIQHTAHKHNEKTWRKTLLSLFS